MDDSMSSSAWSQRRDLQLWLLLTGSCVTAVDDGTVNGLTQKWDVLIRRVHVSYLELPQNELGQISIASVMEDFVYCHHLLPKQWKLPAWADLETSLRANALEEPP